MKKTHDGTSLGPAKNIFDGFAKNHAISVALVSEIYDENWKRNTNGTNHS